MEVYIPEEGEHHDTLVHLKTPTEPPLHHCIQLLTSEEAQLWKKELRREVRNLTMWKNACLQVGRKAEANLVLFEISVLSEWGTIIHFL